MRGAGRGRLRRAAVALLCAAGLALPALPAAAGAEPARPRAAVAFPVSEPFDSATNSGTASGTAAYPDAGWLRLTSASASQAGTWKMKDSFSSDLGFVAEFTYATYGGTAYDGKRGDGLAFYLTDGAAADGAGGFGGALGYACSMSGSVCTGKAGVPGGYLGIGLDEFGNFSSSGVGNGGPGTDPNKIVVRGGGNLSTGYRFGTAATPPGKTVETGTRDKKRTIRVSLLPSGKKMLLSVWSNSGPGTDMTQLITDFDVTTIANQPALPATLKIGFSAGTGAATNTHEIDELKINVPVDLTVRKSVDVTTVAAGGGPVTYTVTVSNSAANDVSGALVKDTVPDLTDVSWTCKADTGSACGKASGSGSVLNTTADLKRGGTVTYTVKGTAPAQPATLRNTATVTAPADRSDTNPADNTATSPATTVTARADVSVLKEALGAGPIAPGESFDYRITASDLGPSDTTDVTVSDTLPAPLSFVSSPDGCTADGRRLSCPVRATLAAGAKTSWTVKVVLDPAYTGDGTDLANTATVRHGVPDPVASNDSGTAAGPPGGAPVPRADLALIKQPTTRPRIAPGETFLYRLSVSNAGPSVARGVTVTDPLPTALTLVPPVTGCTADGRNLTCGPAATLDPGKSVTWFFTVRIDPGYVGDGTTLLNTATVRATTPDPVAGNNSATAGPPGGAVRAPTADLELTKKAVKG
ncbi:hypothetical protein [Streptomyces sp. NPDC089919]|uniref:lectin-like domain-containing protein n=1 Tax=Streptomyces sp. NPDC089919 TaxID=3155188 RepID=UPI003417C7FB